MGATYTRQSSYTDGDTITAAHTNDEFNQLLAAFQASSGHTHDGTANEGGPITKLLGTSITIGDATTGTDITVTFDGETNDGVLKWMEDEDYFEFSDDILIASTEKIQFGDTASFIQQSTDGTLRIDGEAIIDLNASTRVDVSNDLLVGGEVQTASIGFTDGDNAITIADGGGITVVVGASFNDQDITNVGSIALDTITNDGTDITLDSSGDIILDAGGANVVFKDDGTSILDIANNSSDVEFTVSVADKNFAIKGTDGASAITALDIDMALAGKATFNGDVVVGGDLTVTGDDIVMGTNTAGNLLIADGTNFNSVAVGSLSEISTVANDDVFLAVDTSGGGLKKITRSAIVSGLASSAAISNVVEDTSPQLGGDLDTNSANILIDDAHFIADENGNEQIIFQTTSSAVNQFDITNAATGNPPKLSATGGDSNIDLDIEAKGTGHVTVRGNTNSGAIQFNCENNSHGQIVTAQPHSAGVTNTLTLPAGSSSTLVSLVSTDTLTNKSLTAPVLTGSSSAAGSILFKEDTDNGTNAVTLIGPASTADVTVTLPNSAGTVALTSDIPSSGISSGNVATFTSGAADNDFLRIDGTSIEGRSASEVLSDIGGQASLTFGISNTNAVKIDSSSVADDEFARFTANGLESRSTSEVRSDIGLGTAAVLDTGISNTNVAKFTTGVADNDFLRVDGTSIEGRSASEVLSDISAAPAAGDSNILTVGALDSGSITSGFGSIDIGSSALSTTGSVTLGATSFGDNNITNVGSIALDSIASDAGTGTAITFSAGNVPNTQTAGSQTGNVTPDFSQYTNFILTLTGNIVLQDPGDEVAGQSGIFVFIQDGTGSRTLSHADDRYFVAGGTSITLSTGANAIDIVPYFVQADGKIHLGAAQKAFAEA